MRKLAIHMLAAMQIVIVLPIRGRSGYIMAKYLCTKNVVQKRLIFRSHKVLNFTFLLLFKSSVDLWRWLFLLVEPCTMIKMLC